MSLNISETPPPLREEERFSVAVLPVILLLFVASISLCFLLFGLGGAAVALGTAVGAALLLRAANTHLVGERERDKVMAPQLQSSFSCHQPDEPLGWSLTPDVSVANYIRIPRKKLVHKYVVTTDTQARRVTAKRAASSARTISIYGDSYTFGWALDDRETYPWLLQQRFSEHRVLNYGISGYSLYQMLLRLEQTIEHDRPEIVVLGFTPDLEARSTNSYSYMRRLSKLGGVAPSCLSKPGSNHKRILSRYPPQAYKHLAGATQSVVLGLIERYLNQGRFYGRGTKRQRRATTEHLLLSIEKLCRVHAATLHVAYLTAKTDYMEFFHAAGFNWSTCPIDLDSCDPQGRYLYRLEPFDGHPNADANRCYADSIEYALRRIVETGKFRSKLPQARCEDSRRDDAASGIYPMY